MSHTSQQAPQMRGRSTAGSPALTRETKGSTPSPAAIRQMEKMARYVEMYSYGPHELLRNFAS